MGDAMSERNAMQEDAVEGMPTGSIAVRLDAVAHRLVQQCSARGFTVATAESLTAGMTASAIASVPGASKVLRGGAVTYVNEIKHRVLGVSNESLDRYTAVSAPVVREMAQGARELFQVDVAVSLTGYAGPGGGTDDEPVGTVYLGIATKNGVDAVRCHFEGDRLQVRQQAACAALQLVVDHLEDGAR